MAGGKAILGMALRAIGVGAAGYIDADRSTVLFAPNIAWRDEQMPVMPEVDPRQVFERGRQMGESHSGETGKQHLVLVPRLGSGSTPLASITVFSASTSVDAISGTSSARAADVMREVYRPLFLIETPILMTDVV